jgi:hypothetical protein
MRREGLRQQPNAPNPNQQSKVLVMADINGNAAPRRNVFSAIRDAQAVAAGLRDASNVCSAEQQALKTRLIQGAAAIEILCELLQQRA